MVIAGRHWHWYCDLNGIPRTLVRQPRGHPCEPALSCAELLEDLLLIFSAAFVLLALGWLHLIGTGRSKTLLSFKEASFKKENKNLVVAKDILLFAFFLQYFLACHDSNKHCVG